MSRASDELQRDPLPPAEKPARWPWGCAWALAAGQVAWLLARRAPRFETDDLLPWSCSRGRWLPLNVAPEVAAGLAGVSVLLVFWLARRLGGAWAGGLAAGVFVLAGAAGGSVGSSGAQTVALFLLLAGAWRALRFADDPSVANGLAAGVCLGVLPAFSRTGSIGGAAVALWLIWQLRPWWRSWPVVLGVAGPLAWLVAARGAELAALWEKFFRFVDQPARRLWSGDEWSGRLPDARGGLWLILAVLGAAGLVALVRHGRRRAEGVLLAGVAAAMLAFLLLGQSGAWPGQFWILPVPFLVVAGVCLLVRTAERGATGGRLAVAGVVGAQLALGFLVWSANVARERGAEVAVANARAFAEKNLAAGGVIIAPSGLAGGMQPGGKWRLVDARLLGGYRADGAPSAASRVAGLLNGEARERRDQVWSDLRARAQAGPVYWFTRSTASLERALRGRAGYEVVGEFDAPPLARAGGDGGSGFERRGSRTPHADPAQTLTVVRLVFAE